MSEAIELTISGPSETLVGFKFFWLKSVRDTRLEVHCARCLVGPYDRRISRQMRTGQAIPLVGPLVYLCGVSPRWTTNLHVAAALQPGGRFEVETYNGFAAQFVNARRIEIESLDDGYLGLDRTFTTCRNFQFATQLARAGVDQI